MTDNKNEPQNDKNDIQQDDNVVDLKAAAESLDQGEQAGPQEEVVDPLVQLETENKELHEKYLRSVADMQNLVRRTTKEKSDLLKYGNEKMITDLLPVLDSFDKALTDNKAVDNKSDGSSSLLEGMGLVYDQLKTALEKNGLQRIAAKGEKFDPNLHQGIQRVESEEADVETVLEEFAAGYTLNGRVVRAAMVSVSVPKGS